MGGYDAPAYGRTKPPHKSSAKRGAERWTKRRIMDRRQRGLAGQCDRLVVGYWIVPEKSLSGWGPGNRHKRRLGCKSSARRMQLGWMINPIFSTGQVSFFPVSAVTVDFLRSHAGNQPAFGIPFNRDIELVLRDGSPNSAGGAFSNREFFHPPRELRAG